MKTLNAKQERFVEEYLIDLNATQAAIRAGYSESTAAVIGCENLIKPNIQKAIQEAKAERSDRTKINADWVLSRLSEQARADISDLYTTEGSLKPVHEWPEVFRTGLVAGIDVHQEYAYQDGQKVPDGVVMKLKLADRLKVMDQLGNHVGVQAFKSQVETSPGEINLIINRPNAD